MKILLIGCGNMGSAMLSSWLASDLVHGAVIVDRHPNETARRFAAHAHKIEVHADVAALPDKLAPDLIVLAIKPQQMGGMLAELAPRIQSDCPVMTIAAGLRSEFYSAYLPGNILIRAMPNTPALIGQGMTVAVRPPLLPQAIEHMIETLLRTTGDFFWLDNEDQLDAAMAISGSGPGYLFYFTEQLAKAGEAQGLTAEQSARLAQQTLMGTGAMAVARKNESLTQLRQSSITQGGVTAATLAAWDANNAFPNLIAAGIAANRKRAQELAQNK